MSQLYPLAVSCPSFVVFALLEAEQSSLESPRVLKLYKVIQRQAERRMLWALPAFAQGVLTPHAPAGGKTLQPVPAVAWELAPTCGAGQRNADASECLAAVVAAAGGKANGHIKHVDTPLVPPGCSYSHVSGAALFNAGVGQVGSSAEDYQLVCATYKSVAALDEALDEVLPDGGARRIIPVYSCMVPSLETTCTAAKSYSAHRFNFDLPSDAHWLFFGPSYLKEIANSIIAGTAGEIVGTVEGELEEGRIWIKKLVKLGQI